MLTIRVFPVDAAGFVGKPDPDIGPIKACHDEDRGWQAGDRIERPDGRVFTVAGRTWLPDGGLRVDVHERRP